MDRRWVNRGPPNYPFTLNRESPLVRGLVGWWPMLASRGANTLRDLANSNNGNTVDTGWKSSADRGFGLVFNGSSSYVNITSVPLLRPDNITVNVWFRPTSGNVAFAGIVGQPYDTGAWNSPFFSWSVIRDNVNSGLQYRVSLPATHTALGTAAVFVAGQLSMATLTYDGETLIGYVNSIQDGTNSSPSGAIGYDSSFPDLMIGQRSVDSPGEYYSGSTYEVVIWNRALTPIEIYQLYAPQTQWELYQPLYRLQLVRVATIISLNTLTLASSPQALSVTVDEIVALNELTLVSSAPALTVIAVSGQTVLVQTLTLASDTPNLIFAALIVVVFDFNITRAVTFDMGVG